MCQGILKPLAKTSSSLARYPPPSLSRLIIVGNDEFSSSNALSIYLNMCRYKGYDLLI